MENKNKPTSQFLVTQQLLHSKPEDWGFTSTAKAGQMSVLRCFSAYLSYHEQTPDHNSQLTAWPSIKQLAEQAGVNRNTANSVMKYLEYSGVVSIKQNFKRSNLYHWQKNVTPLIGYEEWKKIGSPHLQKQKSVVPFERIEKEVFVQSEMPTNALVIPLVELVENPSISTDTIAEVVTVSPESDTRDYQRVDEFLDQELVIQSSDEYAEVIQLTRAMNKFLDPRFAAARDHYSYLKDNS